MSHYLMGVIVQKNELEDYEDKLGRMEDLIADLIAPYDENIEAEEYLSDCWCKKHLAFETAIKATEQKLGKTLDDIREEFREQYGEETIGNWDKKEEQWQQFANDYFDLRNQYEQELMETITPKIDCNNCEGIGQYLTTYNPLSKWDWWAIGGRWENMIEGTDLSREVISVEEVLEKFDDGKTLFFGYVKPDGEWVEKGKMGWWGIVANEQDKQAWEKEVRKLLENYSDGEHCIIAVDCHI